MMPSNLIPSGSAQAHYDQLLAEYYDWMLGAPFEDKVAEQVALLREIVGEDRGSSLAVDLGCGSGLQSMALAQLGYRVLAIDFSEKLLARLAARAGTHAITPILGDLGQLDCYTKPGTARIVACMGDTLTHMKSRLDVCALLYAVERALEPGGVFVTTYRDLASSQLTGLERFIPVRADEERVMTCFLEYQSADTVMVHDLIYQRDPSGHWSLHKGSYPKLRLSPEWMRDQIEAAGLSVTGQRAGRLVTLTARKASADRP
jgi:predicted TPR repeat methyltransferase